MELSRGPFVPRDWTCLGLVCFISCTVDFPALKNQAWQLLSHTEPHIVQVITLRRAGGTRVGSSGDSYSPTLGSSYRKTQRPCLLSDWPWKQVEAREPGDEMSFPCPGPSPTSLGPTRTCCLSSSILGFSESFLEGWWGFARMSLRCLSNHFALTLYVTD